MGICNSKAAAIAPIEVQTKQAQTSAGNDVSPQAADVTLAKSSASRSAAAAKTVTPISTPAASQTSLVSKTPGCTPTSQSNSISLDGAAGGVLTDLSAHPTAVNSSSGTRRASEQSGVALSQSPSGTVLLLPEAKRAEVGAPSESVPTAQQQHQEIPRSSEPLVLTASTATPSGRPVPLTVDMSKKSDLDKAEAAKEVWVVRKTQDVKQVYAFGQKLGKGNYGVTHVVTHLESGEKYCCKSMNKTEAATEEDLQDMKKEVEIMFLLSGNPHVVTLFEVYEDHTHVHLIMEYCTGGDLFERVVKKGYYTERDAATIVRNILTAIAHCHSMGVIHRDIKPENFLISSPEPDAPVQVTDFGLSTFFREGQVFRQIVGSPFYIAPEVLRKSYSKEADIWSVGVVFYILLSGVPPFYGDTEEEVFKAVLKDPLDFSFAPWPRISRDAKECVERMLIKDPRRRATAEELLNHRWIKANGVASDQNFIDSEVINRLRNFAQLNSLKKEVVKRAVKCLPAEEVAGLKEMFHAIDIDKDGTVSLVEMSIALQKKGFIMSDFELESLLKMTDMNGNGVIDYEEFVAALVHKTRLTRQEYLQEVFNHFDTNRDGFISREELVEALKHHKTKPDIDAIIKEVDQNSDGKISYEEFVDMMTNVDNKASTLLDDVAGGNRSFQRSTSVPWATPNSKHKRQIAPWESGLPQSPVMSLSHDMPLPGSPIVAASL